ncbi:MAG: pyridoxamine 5'-phosphate oxidase family protein [Planctomycetes bacterium]|nr:pyridoxamine 5'-phosphate oxidase family protein [Planctomycetota bacterium]
MSRSYKRITYTDSVKAAQSGGRAGTRDIAQRMLLADSGEDRLSEREIDFIAKRDGFYIGTVSEDGWPYVQYRGGPTGFLKVIDDATLAYADFRGNMQLLSAGNIGHDDRVSLFFMDYARRRRLKILARAEIIDGRDDPALLKRLSDPNYAAKPERAFVLHVEAFDWNCPQHITPRFTEAEIATRERALRDRIAALESQLNQLASSAG